VLADALDVAGRSFAELEVVGGIRGRFPSAGAVANLDEAMESIPAQLEAGYTTICFKPSQYTDSVADVGRLCRHLVRSFGG
jgi:hypothetical protein